MKKRSRYAGMATNQMGFSLARKHDQEVNEGKLKVSLETKHKQEIMTTNVTSESRGF